MSDIFPSISRDELSANFTDQQIAIIDDALRLYGEDLRVNILYDFNGQDWDADGVIFFYADDYNAWVKQFGERPRHPHNRLEHPTSIGHFSNPQTALSLLHRYIFNEQAQS